jgi:signal peptidase I
MAKEKKRTAGRPSGVPVWVRVMCATLALGLGALGYTFFLFKNPSGSMIPTLLVGDRFVTRRGFHTPPRRGDVIVFRFPENPAQEFVKRIAAVPGDTLEALDGRPVINGWLAPHCYVGPYPQEGRTGHLYVEYLGDATYGTLFDQKTGEQACKADAECGEGRCRGGVCGTLQGPFTVHRDEVWVMGDNRNNSHDSRSWRGGLGAGVPFDNVHGTALKVWLGAVGGRFGAPIDGPPVLPPEASALQPALDGCLRDRPPPALTTPPAAK